MRASRERRASRPEAREHHGDALGTATKRDRARLRTRRLRDRRRRRCAPHWKPRVHGHPGVRRAGAAPRRAPDAGVGSLCLGIDPARVSDGRVRDRRAHRARRDRETARTGARADSHVAPRAAPRAAPRRGDGEGDRRARHLGAVAPEGARVDPARGRLDARGDAAPRAGRRGRASPGDGARVYDERPTRRRRPDRRRGPRPRDAGPRAGLRGDRATERPHARAQQGRRGPRRLRVSEGARGRRATRGAHGAPHPRRVARREPDTARRTRARRHRAARAAFGRRHPPRAPAGGGRRRGRRSRRRTRRTRDPARGARLGPGDPRLRGDAGAPPRRDGMRARRRSDRARSRRGDQRLPHRRRAHRLGVRELDPR